MTTDATACQPAKRIVIRRVGAGVANSVTYIDLEIVDMLVNDEVIGGDAATEFSGETLDLV